MRSLFAFETFLKILLLFMCRDLSKICLASLPIRNVIQEQRSEVFKSDSTTTVVTRKLCTYSEGAALIGLNTIQILELAGYQPESHAVLTKDGYIFDIHRIPAPGMPAVYLLPGVFQSSRDFLLNCRGRSIASKLFSGGFDVWLGNFRGNTFGRQHTRISNVSVKFWDFSMDHIFLFDVPATIDYILNITGHAKLNWVGFSLGNTALVGALSTFPEYNEKINVAVAMAPAVYFNKTTSPLLRALAPIQKSLETLANTFLHGEILPQGLINIIQTYVATYCTNRTMSSSRNCSSVFNLIDGRDPGQLNLALIPAILWGLPSPTSARLISQWLQYIISGKFRQFDYGPIRNALRYGNSTPPLYKVTNVKVPMLAIWGENDNLASKQDVARFLNDIPNVIESHCVQWDSWNHLDFLYGKDADILVYDRVLTFLQRFN